jgi:hypothetical protein
MRLVSPLCNVGLPTSHIAANAQRSPSPFFLINPSLQSNISMADFITSTKVCRNCKREKPEDQFMSKKNSSISCGRLTVNCLDCRNRQAPRAPKRTAEHAELPPIHRDGPPLIDLQLCTPINPQESILLGTPVATSSRAGATIPSPAGPSIARRLVLTSTTTSTSSA